MRELGDYTGEDLAFAVFLKEQGWLSVSNKHHTVARLIRPITSRNMIKKGYDTPAFRIIFDHTDMLLRRVILRQQDPEIVETKVLTINQFRAFKKIGGGSA